jgi:hypothetical protein
LIFRLRMIKLVFVFRSDLRDENMSPHDNSNRVFESMVRDEGGMISNDSYTDARR